MVLPCLIQQAATDIHCNACQLTFPRLPDANTSDDLATLAHVHFRTLARITSVVVPAGEPCSTGKGPQTTSNLQPCLHARLRLLAQLVLRHDHDLNFVKFQDSCVIFLGADPKAVIMPVLLKTSQEWKVKMDNQKVQYDHTVVPLRVYVTQTPFQEIRQRFTKVYTAGGVKQIGENLSPSGGDAH